MSARIPEPGRAWPVLVVDDEDDIRELLALLLDDLGFSAIPAANGNQALAVFREERPRLVLTDIKMPGLDGIGLLKAVKELDPEVEVIMISGHGDMDLAIQSLKHAAADFIPKPIDDDVLAHALGKARERVLMRAQIKEHTEHLERLVEEKSRRVVELERGLAARQVVEGLASSLTSIAGQMDEPGLLTDLPCFVSVHSRDLRILSANESFRERFPEPEGKPSWFFHQAGAPGGQDCPVALTVARGRGEARKSVLKDRDGTPVPVAVFTTPVADGQGRVELVLEVSVDLSHMQSLKEELRRTRQRYEDLFNAVPSFITVQDRNLGIVAANRAFLRDFGRLEPGTRCHQAYMKSADPCRECPVQAVFADGNMHRMETVVTARDGRPMNLWVRAVPLLDEAGNVAQVMEVATDITAIRELQDHLSSLGMMLGSMSHGVKGLLMGLDGGMYRVDSGLARGDLDRLRSGWGTVRHRIERIRKMILDILYYAKSRDLETAPLDLPSFIRDLAEGVGEKALASGVVFTADLGAAPARLEADGTALASALLNFLENAVDACLCDMSGKERRVSLAVREAGGQAVFEIADTGVGMDQETREKMFTLFFSSKGSQGTGIGLFVSSRVVAQHHGRIEVESEPGQGTAFRVFLPLVQPGGQPTGLIPAAPGAGKA
jgi:signal transduction histidine kinase/FixJ family two-component response regulator